VEVVAEGRLDELALVLAQQAVVDEDAGELVADGPVQQGGDDGRIDAAGEAADDAVADLLADARSFCREVAHAPVPAQPQTS
jgi:hypothetical protein